MLNVAAAWAQSFRVERSANGDNELYHVFEPIHGQLSCGQTIVQVEHFSASRGCCGDAITLREIP